MTLPAFPTLVLVAALIVETALIVWLLVLGIQARADARRSRAALDMTLYERPELPRRPGEFGPLYRPWSEIQRLRAAILADQLDGPLDDHVAVDLGQHRIGLSPYVAAGEAAESMARPLYWLAHWDDSPTSVTGLGAPA